MGIKLTISIKQFLVNLLLPLIVIGFVGIILFISVRNIVTEKVLETNIARAYQVRDSLEIEVSNNFQILKSISNNPDIINFVSSMPDSLKEREFTEIPEYNDVIKNLAWAKTEDAVNNIYLASNNSKNVISDKWIDRPQNFNALKQSWFQGASSLGDLFATEPYNPSDSDIPIVTLSYPIRNNGGIIGVIAIDMDLTIIINLLKNAADYYNTSFTIFSGNSGKIIWSKDNELKDNISLNDYKKFLIPLHGEEKSDELVKGIMSFQAQTFKALTNSGETHFYQSVPVSLITFGLMLDMPEKSVNVSVFYSLIGPFIGALSLFVGILVLGFLITVFSVVRPIKKTIENLKELAEGNGDLTVKMDESRRDETGDLASYFNLFVLKLLTLMLNVKSSILKVQGEKEHLLSNSHETASATQEISKNIESINDQMIVLNSEIQSVSTAMEEIMATVDGLNNGTDQQHKAFEQSSSAVEEMIAQINSVAQVVRDKKNSAEELVDTINNSERTIENVTQANVEIQILADEVSVMSTVISDIADQTNILSMNAAIEAAHAGDAGKGFSVVADEIRKLAESSRDNSDKIKNVIKDIINKVNLAATASKENEKSFGILSTEIHSTIDALEEINVSTQELNEGGEQILHANEKLSEVTDFVSASAKEMSTTVQAVTESTQQVSSISQNVTEGVQEISVGTNEISLAMNDVQDISRALSSASDELHEETSKFKTEDGVKL